MKRMLSIALLGLAALPLAAQTLDECQEAAVAHYPLAKQYGIIGQTADATLANIDKGWLPQVSTYAQATTQDKVVALPDALTGMMAAQGVELRGLAKQQYKIGVDINQNIYDGGRMRSRKDVARQQAETDRAQTDVTLYGVRQRVNDLYFGMLLIADKLQLNADLQELLRASEHKLAAMERGGTAATADLYAVRAERLNAAQAAVELRAQQSALRRMLAWLTGLEVTTPSKPQDTGAAMADTANHRLELRLFDRQRSLADARERALDAQLRPTLSAFAQGYYGYPGFNMYRDMMRRTPSLNALVGVRLSWNIGALYTRAGDKQRLDLQRQGIEAQRETFLFNNRMENIQQQENIDKYTRLLQQDDDIIALRTQVRRAAESKLEHGIIDVNDLIKEINSENAARLQRSMHEMERLRELYNHKLTLNHPS